MIRLRSYKDCDAIHLLKWMEDESTFVKWSANHFEYPLTMEQCISYREKHDKETDSWLFSGLDMDGNVVGHIMFCKMNFVENSVHLGHVIVDSSNRGNGLGKELLKAALEYGFNILKVDRVTLAVFDNNSIASNCYRSIGFKVYDSKPESFPYKEEMWGCDYMEAFK